MNDPFPDHFSAVAGDYAAYRPTYPAELFDWLAVEAPGRRLAWDCACGSGQASLALAERFARVVATDASAAQIAAAPPDPRVTYRVAPADRSGLEPGSVDLITVAQALHWLDLEAFYVESRRVLVSEGLIAAWTYGAARLDDPALDTALRHFQYEVLGRYWPPERAAVDTAYRFLSFPFEELRAPRFEMSVDWRLEDLVGYVRTWSAARRFEAEHGADPASLLRGALEPRWGGAARRCRVIWPLAMRVGRPEST